MKLIGSRDELLKGFQAVVGAVAKKSSLPVLGHFLVTGDGERLTVTASDLQVTLTARVEDGLEPHEPFAICLPRRAYDILKAFPEDGKVTLEVEDEKATLKCGRSRFVLQTLPAEDFPQPEEQEALALLPFAASELRGLLQHVQHGMAHNDTRYYLNGLLLHFSPTNSLLTVAATDGHRLALITQSIDDCPLPEAERIVPRAVVGEMLKLLKADDYQTPVSLVVFEKKIGLLAGTTMLVSTVIDGKYPDVWRVIPTSSGTSIKVEREPLLQALRRAKLAIGDLMNLGVRLSFGPEEVRVSVGGTEPMEDAVAVESVGPDVETGLNCDYLCDALEAIDDDFVRIELTDAQSPVKVTGDSRDEGIHVVMPMRL